MLDLLRNPKKHLNSSIVFVALILGLSFVFSLQRPVAATTASANRDARLLQLSSFIKTDLQRLSTHIIHTQYSRDLDSDLSNPFKSLEKELTLLQDTLKKNQQYHQHMREIKTLSQKISLQHSAFKQEKGILHEIHATRTAIMEIIMPLLVDTDEIIKILLKNKASHETIYLTTRQMFLLERISRNMAQFESVNQEDNVVAVDRLGRDTALFMRISTALRNGDNRLQIEKIASPEARKIFDKLSEHEKKLGDYISKFIDITPNYFSFLDKLQEQRDTYEKLFETLAQIETAEFSK